MPFPSIRRLVAASTLAGAALVTACGGDSATAPEAPTTGIRLTNSSNRTVTSVYISSCSSDSWGADRLNGTLAPAAIRTFTLEATGCYDMRVVATDGHSWRRDDITVQGTVGVKVE